MPKYGIGTGVAGIYAGILKNKNEFKDKSEVTEQALSSVAIFLLEDTDSHSWEHPIKNHKKIVLTAKVVMEEGEGE